MKTSETDPIRLDFVVSKDYPSLNRLGMTLAPGKKVQNAAGKDWDRDLESDLSRLKHHYEVDSLVSLVAFEELERLRIEDLPRRCRSKSIELIQFPIKDGFTPPAYEEFSRLVEVICERLSEGSTVAVHCRGGLGRTGLTAACVVVGISEGKINGQSAIEMVRNARAGTIETQEQEKFVVGFADHWKSA